MKDNTDRKSIIKGYMFVILSAIIFGTMPLMAKIIYTDGVNSLTLVFLRNFLALPFFAVIGIFNGNSLKISLKDIPSVSLIALVGCSATPLLLFSSYNYMDSGTATVFHFIYPGVVVLIEVLFLKKKIKPITIFSLLLCLGGICLFYTPGNPISPVGSIYAFSSGVTYAMYVVLLATFRRKELSGWVLSFYISLISSVVLLTACFITGELMFPQSFKGWALSLVFALAINVGAVVMFQGGARIVGGEKASILSTFEPVTSVVAGVVAFHEKVSFRTAVGTLLVICASILITVFDKKREK